MHVCIHKIIGSVKKMPMPVRDQQPGHKRSTASQLQPTCCASRLGLAIESTVGG